MSHPNTIYTVSRLTDEIQALLGEHFDFVWIEGEISNFSAPISGHYYMVLKDEKAQIRAIMFRLQARHLKFVPENGMKVLAQGKIGVYPLRGEYQIVLDYLEPMGIGTLAIAFEQLKKKLAEKGLFDQGIKKPLPFLPQRVAVITSPTGAAIKDFLNVIHRRFANIEILVVPVRVQGEGATADIVNALGYVNRKLDVDVIVLTRGGGSLEDLWPFNQEDLAIAIRDSRIPVVSAVGHEIDVTISDLAADFRAPTPSAAAELLVMEKESLETRLSEIHQRLTMAIRKLIKLYFLDLEGLSKRLRDPKRDIAENWMRLDDYHSRLVRLMGLIISDSRKRLSGEKRSLIHNSPGNYIKSMRQQVVFHRISLSRATSKLLEKKAMEFSILEKRIKDLGPMAILKRGYSIARKLPEKSILIEASSVKKGDRIEVLLAEGELECLVDRKACQG